MILIKNIHKINRLNIKYMVIITYNNLKMKIIKKNSQKRNQFNKKENTQMLVQMMKVFQQKLILNKKKNNKQKNINKKQYNLRNIYNKLVTKRQT